MLALSTIQGGPVFKDMRKTIRGFLFIVFIFIIQGCGQVGYSEFISRENITLEPSRVVSSDLSTMGQEPRYLEIAAKEFGEVTGLLFIIDMDRPLSVMRAMLSPAIMEEDICHVPPIITGGREELGDVIFYTDADGRFIASSVKPGHYFIIVNYPDHTEIAKHPNDPTKPLCIELRAGTKLDLGTLYVHR